MPLTQPAMTPGTQQASASPTSGKGAAGSAVAAPDRAVWVGQGTRSSWTPHPEERSATPLSSHPVELRVIRQWPAGLAGRFRHQVLRRSGRRGLSIPLSGLVQPRLDGGRLRLNQGDLRPDNRERLLALRQRAFQAFQAQEPLTEVSIRLVVLVGAAAGYLGEQRRDRRRVQCCQRADRAAGVPRPGMLELSKV